MKILNLYVILQQVWMELFSIKIRCTFQLVSTNLAPRIVNTFIESGDFAGKTVIPFATSGSSSISNAEKELQTNYPGINWGKGRLLNGASRETVKQWIKK